MKLASIIIVVIIFILQQLQINSLIRQVNTLTSVCNKLHVLNDKQIQAAKEMLELIKTQRNATEAIYNAVNQACENAELNKAD